MTPEGRPNRVITYDMGVCHLLEDSRDGGDLVLIGRSIFRKDEKRPPQTRSPCRRGPGGGINAEGLACPRRPAAGSGMAGPPSWHFMRLSQQETSGDRHLA